MILTFLLYRKDTRSILDFPSFPRQQLNGTDSQKKLLQANLCLFSTVNFLGYLLLGAPNDDFRLNTLKTLFRLSKVL